MISKEKYKDMKNTQMLYKSVNEFAHDYRVSWYIANKVWNSKSYKDYSTKKEPKKVTVTFDKPATKHIENKTIVALKEYVDTMGDYISAVDRTATDAHQLSRHLDTILTATVNKTTDINTRLVGVERERTLQKWFNLLVAILASTALVLSMVW